MKTFFAMTLLALLLAGLNLAAQAQTQLVVAQGKTAKLALRTPISSKLNEAGDRVTAELVEDVPDQDRRVAIPARTEFTGRITQIQAARRLQREASMTIVFETMRLDHGVETIHAVVTAIDDYANDNKMSANGRNGKTEGGRSAARTGRNVTTGAMAGSLIGLVGVLNGGGYRSFQIGLDVGVVGGVILTKGNEIRLGPETILRIRFDRPVTLPATE